MALPYAHEARLRLPMPVQLLQNLSHSARVDDNLVLPIGRFHRIQITLDGLALVHAARIAHSQKLRSVDSHPFAAHQPHRKRKANQLGARLSHRLAVDAPELGFKTPRRADLLQIAIKITLQKIARIVAKSPRLSRIGTLEPQFVHRQSASESVDYATDAVDGNQIVQYNRKQRTLGSSLTLNEAHEKCPRLPRGHFPIISRPYPDFRNSLQGRGFLV
jgi:hypothetical protein